MKTATEWIEDGAFALFFRPHRRAFGSSSVAAPGGGRGVAGRSLTDALLGQVLADWGKPSVEWNPLCTGHFKTPLSSIKHFFPLYFPVPQNTHLIPSPLPPLMNNAHFQIP